LPLDLRRWRAARTCVRTCAQEEDISRDDCRTIIHYDHFDKKKRDGEAARLAMARSTSGASAGSTGSDPSLTEEEAKQQQLLLLAAAEAEARAAAAAAGEDGDERANEEASKTLNRVLVAYAVHDNWLGYTQVNKRLFAEAVAVRISGPGSAVAALGRACRA
jgi:hypothetical protein